MQSDAVRFVIGMMGTVYAGMSAPKIMKGVLVPPDPPSQLLPPGSCSNGGLIRALTGTIFYRIILRVR